MLYPKALLVQHLHDAVEFFVDSVQQQNLAVRLLGLTIFLQKLFELHNIGKMYKYINLSVCALPSLCRPIPSSRGSLDGPHPGGFFFSFSVVVLFYLPVSLSLLFCSSLLFSFCNSFSVLPSPFSCSLSSGSSRAVKSIGLYSGLSSQSL